MEDDDDNMTPLLEERLKLASWMQNLDATHELSSELREKAMVFRESDGIMRYAREIIRKIDPDYKSENEKKDARPKVPPKDPTAKTNPHGRGLWAETKKKLDEQAVAREKLEALANARADEKKKTPAIPKASRSCSPSFWCQVYRETFWWCASRWATFPGK